MTMANAQNPIKVLYEDDCFIVFEKPAGLLVVPTPQQEKNTLENIVNDQYRSIDFKLYPCHRLDRETSGAILFARGKYNQDLMRGLFHKKQVKKKYIAFCQGRLTKATGEIRIPIPDTYEKKFYKRPQAQPALTRYKVLHYKKNYCVVEVEPVTGRTNQIRIHFSLLGHPVVGDRKYSIAREYKLKFRRSALHASSLEWVHPMTQKKIIVQSPLPNDMEVFLERNRN